MIRKEGARGGGALRAAEGPRARGSLLRRAVGAGAGSAGAGSPRSHAPARAIEGKAMRRTLWRVVSLVFVVGLALIACDGPNRSQSPSSASGFILEVTISPNPLRGATPGTDEAQGACGAVHVTVVDVHGRFVDGAQVRVTTTLGRFPATSARQEAVGVG